MPWDFQITWTWIAWSVLLIHDASLLLPIRCASRAALSHCLTAEQSRLLAGSGQQEEFSIAPLSLVHTWKETWTWRLNIATNTFTFIIIFFLTKRTRNSISRQSQSVTVFSCVEIIFNWLQRSRFVLGQNFFRHRQAGTRQVTDQPPLRIKPTCWLISEFLYLRSLPERTRWSTRNSSFYSETEREGCYRTVGTVVSQAMYHLETHPLKHTPRRTSLPNTWRRL